MPPSAPFLQTTPADVGINQPPPIMQLNQTPLNEAEVNQNIPQHAGEARSQTAQQEPPTVGPNRSKGSGSYAKALNGFHEPWAASSEAMWEAAKVLGRAK